MNEKEIEETVKAFKVYLTKVIKHSAIDYIRKVKKAKYIEILYNDIIDSVVSLSEWDNDTFFDFRYNAYWKLRLVYRGQAFVCSLRSE